MLETFRSSYGIKDTSDKLPKSFQKEINRGVWGLMALGILITAGLVAAVFVHTTDRSTAREAVERAAARTDSVMRHAPGTVADRQAAVETAIGADHVLNGREIEGTMRTVRGGRLEDLRCRVEWAGRPPEFAGTRFVTMNRRGGTVATLMVKDLSTHSWTIETASPLLFWR